MHRYRSVAAVSSAARHQRAACKFQLPVQGTASWNWGADRSELERYAQGAGEYGSAPGVTFIKGMPIVLESASSLYAALNGAGALRPYVQGTDDVSHAAISN